MDPPGQSGRDACHTTTPTTGSIAHIDTKGRWTPLVNQAEMPAIPLHQLLDLLHIYIPKADGPSPQGKTARAQSELFTVQCCQ